MRIYLWFTEAKAEDQKHAWIMLMDFSTGCDQVSSQCLWPKCGTWNFRQFSYIHQLNSFSDNCLNPHTYKNKALSKIFILMFSIFFWHTRKPTTFLFPIIVIILKYLPFYSLFSSLEMDESLEKDGMKNDFIFFVGLFGFYGLSTFLGYLMPNLFLYK